MLLHLPIRKTIEGLLSRRLLPDAGFVGRLHGSFQIDSTAWGILALRANGGSEEILEGLRVRLAREQEGDGRVCVSRGHPASYWPTSLAVLAWQNSQATQAAQNLAIRFLLEASGTHFARRPDDLSAHDPTLKGWSWIENTHSWVEPTAMCVMALRATRNEQHDRVHEASRMILDRQLPHGGWNAGNTVVFGRELHPNPEGTGSALTGLAGMVDRDKVVRSIEYLHGEVDRLRTPISLGWSLLGLAAWGLWPSNGVALVERCLANQSRYGEYDTSALCLLFLGALAGDPDADISLFPRSRRNQISAAPSH